MANLISGKRSYVLSLGMEEVREAASSVRDTLASSISSNKAREHISNTLEFIYHRSPKTAVAKSNRRQPFGSRRPLLVVLALLSLFAASKCQFTVLRALVVPVSVSETALYTKQGTNGVDYREYITGEKLFWCTPGDKAAAGPPWESGKIFDKQGTLLASAPTTIEHDLRYSSVLTADMKVWVSAKNSLGGTNQVIIFQITKSSGMFSITQVGGSLNYLSSKYGTGGYNDPGTNYIFLGPSSVATFNIIQRLDTQAQTFTHGSATGFDDVIGDTYRMYQYPGDLILLSGNYNFVYVATKSTMAYLDKRDMRLTASDERSFVGLKDNLSDNYFHSQGISGAAFEKRVRVLSYASGTFSEPLPMLSSVEPAVYGMANLGTLQYYAFSRITSSIATTPSMFIVNKLTNTLPTADFRTGIALSPSTSGMTFMEMDNTDSGYIGLFTHKKDTTASVYPNFNSYLIIMDICLTRGANICTACPSSPTQTYFSSQAIYNRCWTKSQFPPRFGVNLANSVVTACSQASCLSCKDDHTKCTDCDGTDVLREDTSQCVPHNFFITNPIPSGYGYVLGGPKVIVRKCQSTTCSDCRNCSANHAVCQDPGTPGGSWTGDIRGRVYQIPQIDAALIVTSILKGINFAFKALLMPLNSLVAYQIDRTIAFCSFLRVIEGPVDAENFFVIYHFSSTTLFPFWISNPYAEAVMSSCETKSNYSIHGVACNFLTNYGQNLNIILAALFLNSLVCLVYFLAYKKPVSGAQESSISTKLRVLNRFFGFRYFFTFMDGVSLELFGWVIVNIVGMHYDSNGPMVGGFILSLIILFYYLGSAFFMYKFLAVASAEKKTGMDTSELKYSTFDFVIENYRSDLKKPFMIYTPLIVLGKNFTFQIFALILSNQKYGMVIFVCIVEAAFLGYTCWAWVRRSIVDNLFDVFTSGIALSYFIAKGASFEGSCPATKARYQTMNLLLFILNCVHIVYAIFTFVLSILSGLSPAKATVAPKPALEAVRPSSPKESSKLQLMQDKAEKQLLSNPATKRESLNGLPEDGSSRGLKS